MGRLPAGFICLLKLLLLQSHFQRCFHLSERATLHNKLHWCNQIFPQIKLGLIGCPQDCSPPSQQSCPPFPLVSSVPRVALKQSLSQTRRGGLHPTGCTGVFSRRVGMGTLDACYLRSHKDYSISVHLRVFTHFFLIARKYGI